MKYEHRNTLFPFGEFLHYTDKRENINEDEIKNYLATLNLKGLKIKSIKPNIEDCFMALMEDK
jgi:hypothetical protein